MAAERVCCSLARSVVHYLLRDRAIGAHERGKNRGHACLWTVGCDCFDFNRPTGHMALGSRNSFCRTRSAVIVRIARAMGPADAQTTTPRTASERAVSRVGVDESHSQPAWRVAV